MLRVHSTRPASAARCLGTTLARTPVAAYSGAMTRPPHGSTGLRHPARHEDGTPVSSTDEVALAVALALVEDLQGTTADLGWPEATALADALVDGLSHVLVDLASGRPRPTSHPAVVGAVGGPPAPLEHASCRVATAALRRAGAVLLEAGPAWATEGGDVALSLADLVERCAERERAGRLRPTDKGPVLRELRGLQRRLHALAQDGCGTDGR